MKKKASKKVGVVWKTTKRDQFTVVLEDVRSQFKIFGESLALTRESLGLQIDDLSNEMHKEFALIHLTLEQHGQRIAQLEHANLELLKEIRENTISRSEFEDLRAKVRQLESRITK